MEVLYNLNLGGVNMSCCACPECHAPYEWRGKWYCWLCWNIAYELDMMDKNAVHIKKGKEELPRTLRMVKG